MLSLGMNLYCFALKPICHESVYRSYRRKSRMPFECHYLKFSIVGGGLGPSTTNTMEPAEVPHGDTICGDFDRPMIVKHKCKDIRTCSERAKCGHPICGDPNIRFSHDTGVRKEIGLHSNGCGHHEVSTFHLSDVYHSPYPADRYVECLS